MPKATGFAEMEFSWWWGTKFSPPGFNVAALITNNVFALGCSAMGKWHYVAGKYTQMKGCHENGDKPVIKNLKIFEVRWEVRGFFGKKDLIVLAVRYLLLVKGAGDNTEV